MKKVVKKVVAKAPVKKIVAKKPMMKSGGAKKPIMKPGGTKKGNPTSSNPFGPKSGPLTEEQSSYVNYRLDRAGFPRNNFVSRDASVKLNPYTSEPEGPMYRGNYEQTLERNQRAGNTFNSSSKPNLAPGDKMTTTFTTQKKGGATKAAYKKGGTVKKVAKKMADGGPTAIQSMRRNILTKRINNLNDKGVENQIAGNKEKALKQFDKSDKLRQRRSDIRQKAGYKKGGLIKSKKK